MRSGYLASHKISLRFVSEFYGSPLLSPRPRSVRVRGGGGEGDALPGFWRRNFSATAFFRSGPKQWQSVHPGAQRCESLSQSPTLQCFWGLQPSSPPGLSRQLNHKRDGYITAKKALAFSPGLPKAFGLADPAFALALALFRAGDLRHFDLDCAGARLAAEPAAIHHEREDGDYDDHATENESDECIGIAAIVSHTLAPSLRPVVGTIRWPLVTRFPATWRLGKVEICHDFRACRAKLRSTR